MREIERKKEREGERGGGRTSERGQGKLNINFYQNEI